MSDIEIEDYLFMAFPEEKEYKYDPVTGRTTDYYVGTDEELEEEE